VLAIFPLPVAATNQSSHAWYQDSTTKTQRLGFLQATASDVVVQKMFPANTDAV
jgi:hypothetical protein